MNKIKIILFSLCLSASAVLISPCQAQNDSIFQFQKLIPGTYSYLTVDNLNNVYIINETNQLKKIYANGDSASVFNDVKQFGNPSYIDVSNPLKILLYYNKYATTVVLDRFLNVRNTLNFRKQNIFLVNSIGTSYDNNIWLFDEQNFSLKKIDDEGKAVQESVDWRLLFDTMPSPIKLMDRNTFVYLYDSTKGFYIFDYYGSFKTKLPFKSWHFIEISGDYIFGFNENKLYSYHLKTTELKEYVMPSFIKDYTSIEAMNGKLYILKKEGVEIYSIQQ
jgi:hypothetical protein